MREREMMKMIIGPGGTRVFLLERANWFVKSLDEGTLHVCVVQRGKPQGPQSLYDPLDGLLAVWDESAKIQCRNGDDD